MIASLDSTDWIIGTPSKTGSQRLMTALTGERKSYPQGPLARALPPRHGGRWREFSEFDLRVMTARKPLERWNSLFWYRRTMIESAPLDPYLDDFSAYLDAVARRESSHQSLTPQHVHLRRWDPHVVVPVGEVGALWELIDAPPWWRDVYWGSPRHRTHEKRPLAETLHAHGPLTERARQMIEDERRALDDYGAWEVEAPERTGPVQFRLSAPDQEDEA